MITRTNQVKHIESACNTLESAHKSTDLRERDLLFESAIVDLNAANELGIVNLIVKIRAGDANPCLLTTVVNGLRRSFDLL